MNLRIKTKRDWFIAFFLIFLILYYISMLFNGEIEVFMMRFSPDKLSYMNYPGSWGNLMFIGVVMTLLLLVIMLLQKFSVKHIIIAISIGVLFSFSMFAGFLIHTNLIVGTSKTMNASNVWITCPKKQSSIFLEKDDPFLKNFVKAAVSLKKKPISNQKEISTIDEDEDVYHVWISYPKKFGESYDLIFYIMGDSIYLYHGIGNPSSRIFYKDNGLLELMKKIIKEYET